MDMNPKYNIKPMIEDFQNQVGKEGGMEGWDIDLLALCEEIFKYAETLEDRIENLEERR